jgi:hypothetical protein
MAGLYNDKAQIYEGTDLIYEGITTQRASSCALESKKKELT